MTIKAQFGMVMNLDKCIGCHTCSVTCNNVWTNRKGAEYMWWNNVETKPGIGYPKEWENQEKHKGGWTLLNDRLELKAGGRSTKLSQIFYNPHLTPIDDYYEPWTYDYEELTKSPLQKHQPVARPKSLLTGEYLELKWGPNWEDDLAGVHVTGKRDYNFKGIEEKIRFEFEQTFMIYLPRICEHCINPSCLASCPSGAIYKREEDGIVLVDQEACRSWRFCMTGCPYKKTYYNWNTQKAEKCTFCYPRIEAGLPTVCSETCVGRLRYIGIVLYDSERIKEVASTKDEKELYQAQLSMFLDPNDPNVIEQARHDGIPEGWLEAAKRSPIYKLAVEYGVALPLHPEFRTLPMVWYVPPLSPIMNAFQGKGGEEDASVLFPAIEQLRIPIEYLANLLTAGDTEIIRNVLKKMVAMRQYMRALNIRKQPDSSLLQPFDFTDRKMQEMYRLLAIAKYSDRFVIPTAHRENTGDLQEEQGIAGISFLEGCQTCSTEYRDEMDNHQLHLEVRE
ncbi:nitrate reductase subunit beta [Tepidibacillus decaturensis]|uniref:Nitrate reductase n=1 Tax=Tepidibacillus decaturensis TaxID=1413211 RepID=A0A135L4C5_9BACI|nr:nitrate reductase subunit beta [Tepidibacillus decaturensis]KXG43864.1 nitrate reductase [Tepidibacillus decaturensis]